MTVTVPVNLTPAEESALVARAKAEGLSVDALLHEAVLRLVLSFSQPEPLTTHEWEQEFGDWLDSMPNFRSLSDEEIGRESIYTREDEWR